MRSNLFLIHFSFKLICKSKNILSQTDINYDERIYNFIFFSLRVFKISKVNLFSYKKKNKCIFIQSRQSMLVSLRRFLHDSSYFNTEIIMNNLSTSLFLPHNITPYFNIDWNSSCTLFSSFIYLFIIHHFTDDLEVKHDLRHAVLPKLVI